jgi:hypothetical protein
MTCGVVLAGSGLRWATDPAADRSANVRALGTYRRPRWIIALLGSDSSLIQVIATIEIVPQIQVLELVLIGIGTVTVPS